MRFLVLHVLPTALLVAALATCRPPVSTEALTDGVWVGERGP